MTKISLTPSASSRLSISVSESGWPNAWVIRENSREPFAGQTPIDYMILRGTPGMAEDMGLKAGISTDPPKAAPFTT